MALPGIVQHGFTHFRLDLTILAGTIDNPIDGIWASPEQFKDYAFPTLTKKSSAIRGRWWRGRGKRKRATADGRPSPCVVPGDQMPPG